MFVIVFSVHTSVMPAEDGVKGAFYRDLYNLQQALSNDKLLILGDGEKRKTSCHINVQESALHLDLMANEQTDRKT